MGESIEEYVAYLDEINRGLGIHDISRTEDSAVSLRSQVNDIDWDFSILSDDPLRYCNEDERREILRQLGIEG